MAEYFELLKSGRALFGTNELDYVYGRPYTVLASDPYGEMLAGRPASQSYSGRTLYNTNRW
jgi:hypothetical protein